MIKLQNDTLYMDGSDTKVVVSGYNSQKVKFCNISSSF